MESGLGVRKGSQMAQACGLKLERWVPSVEIEGPWQEQVWGEEQEAGDAVSVLMLSSPSPVFPTWCYSQCRDQRGLCLSLVATQPAHLLVASLQQVPPR